MGGYQTVVVGTDGSETSFRAVDRAAALARDAGATLVIACAYEPVNDTDLAHDKDVLGAEAYQVVGSAPAEDTVGRRATAPSTPGATDDRDRRGAGQAGRQLQQVVKERAAPTCSSSATAA